MTNPRALKVVSRKSRDEIEALKRKFADELTRVVGEQKSTLEVRLRV